MRTLKACVIGLALLAGACGPTENGGTGEPAADAGTKARAPRKQPPPSEDDKEQAARRELQRLEGTWVALDVEHDGEKLTSPGDLKWVIRNGRCGVYLDQQKHETWALKPDASREPRTVEARLVVGQNGQRLAGIYELGGDRLKVCYDTTGRDFPTEFSAPKGARRVNYVFRREE